MLFLHGAAPLVCRVRTRLRISPRRSAPPSSARQNVVPAWRGVCCDRFSNYNVPCRPIGNAIEERDTLLFSDSNNSIVLPIGLQGRLQQQNEASPPARRSLLCSVHWRLGMSPRLRLAVAGFLFADGASPLVCRDIWRLTILPPDLRWQGSWMMQPLYAAAVVCVRESRRARALQWPNMVAGGGNAL